MLSAVFSAGTGQWIRDYGALVLAGVAAVVSAYNAVSSHRSVKKDWLRQSRMKAYSEFAGAASNYLRTVALMAATQDRAKRFELLAVGLQEFQTAQAQVLIVGPVEVSRPASILHDVVDDVGLKVRNDPKTFSETDFARAMNEFIEAASEALGVGYAQEDADFKAWREMKPPPRNRWPSPSN